MWSVIWVGILKRVRESFVFRSNIFTTCKIKDGKEIENSLMVFYAT